MERAARRCRPSSRPPRRESSPRPRASRATTARTFQRLGLNAIWAPSLEVGPEDGGAMGTRAFSDEPDQVAAYAQAAVEEYARRARAGGARALPRPRRGGDRRPRRAPPNVGLTAEELRTRDLVPLPRRDPRRRAGDRRRPRAVRRPTTSSTPASQSRAIVIEPAARPARLPRPGDRRRPDAARDHHDHRTCPRPRCASIAAGVDMVYVPGPEAAGRRDLRRAAGRGASGGGIPRRPDRRGADAHPGREVRPRAAARASAGRRRRRSSSAGRSPGERARLPSTGRRRRRRPS